MWAFLVEGSLWLSFIIGIAFAVLPFAMCFALAVVNRNSIFGGLRKATSLGLELNKSYGLFFWKQITHYGIFHCEERFEYSLIREIIVFPKRSSLLIFTGGYSSSYLTGELPKTVRYYPTSEHPFAGRWILIPLVFEDNNGVVSHLASVSHVQVRISDSVDLEGLE